MSEIITKYDNPKSKLDEEDVWDIIDDLRRFIDGLKTKIKELEKQHESDITLYWTVENQNSRLKARIKELEALLNKEDLNKYENK
jgi:cell shape-determining protein MreC